MTIVWCEHEHAMSTKVGHCRTCKSIDGMAEVQCARALRTAPIRSTIRVANITHGRQPMAARHLQFTPESGVTEAIPVADVSGFREGAAYDFITEHRRHDERERYRGREFEANSYFGSDTVASAFEGAIRRAHRFDLDEINESWWDAIGLCRREVEATVARITRHDGMGDIVLALNDALEGKSIRDELGIHIVPEA